MLQVHPDRMMLAHTGLEPKLRAALQPMGRAETTAQKRGISSAQTAVATGFNGVTTLLRITR